VSKTATWLPSGSCSISSRQRFFASSRRDTEALVRYSMLKLVSKTIDRRHGTTAMHSESLEAHQRTSQGQADQAMSQLMRRARSTRCLSRSLRMRRPFAVA